MSKSDNTNKQERLFFFYTAEYLNHYLPRQAGQSSNTQKQYRIGLSQFYDFIGTYPNFAWITPESTLTQAIG